MIIIVTVTFLSFCLCHRATLHISTCFVYVCLSHVRVFCCPYTADLSHHTISIMCTMLYFRFDMCLFQTFLHIVCLHVLYVFLCVLGCYAVRPIVVFMFVCVLCPCCQTSLLVSFTVLRECDFFQSFFLLYVLSVESFIVYLF